MERKDLLHQCRYYKGERENPHPEGNEALFWDYERAWIEEMVNDSNYLSECISDYIGIGLKDFEKMDNTPLSLKAILFNRYAKGSYSMMDAVEPFKMFYRNHYTK